jgi:hypothetical protein
MGARPSGRFTVVHPARPIFRGVFRTSHVEAA